MSLQITTPHLPSFRQARWMHLQSMWELPIIRSSPEGEGYKILDETLNTEQYAIGFKKGNQELCDVVNADLKN